MNLDMAMFHQAFFEEAADLLADLEDHLLHLSETPDDHELLNSIFRCAHSIKGGSATFGFADIAHFTHGLETLLDKVRNGQIQVEERLTQLLLESLDQMKALLAVARGEASFAPDSAPLITRIEAAISASGAGTVPMSAPPPSASIAQAGDADFSAYVQREYHLRFVPGLDILRQANDPLVFLGKLGKIGEIQSITCDPSRIPSLKEMDPEVCYLAWDVRFWSDQDEEEIRDIFEFVADESEIIIKVFAEVEKQSETEEKAPIVSSENLSEKPSAPPTVPSAGEATTPAVPLANSVSTPEKPSVRAAAPQVAPPKADTQTIRVSTDKVDKLINLVGELVINQSMLNEVIQDFSMAKLPRLTEAVAEMERASRELQERVMAVRMLPIKHAFGRFPRLVHDLSVQCGKRIELKMTGEDTELDKSVIEAIADPLTHLVRNSVDHGLETPEQRREAGKSEMGTVMLNAFHEGGNIVVEVSDDGRGLNREKILKKALERGLISTSDSETMSDEAACNLIFAPGFSTADKVTDLSGRGVGMDIVKQAVQALGGSITLSSVPGKGTRFRIRLPLTMAILEGLSLSVGEEVYILPLTSIVESIRPRPADVRKVVGSAEVVQVRGEILPILRLYQVFGVHPFFTDPTQALLVILENDGRKVAVLVDELIGQSQVVIKSLETNYRKVDGIAGATILGDGRVALILDVPGLIRGTQGAASYAVAA